MGVFLRNKKGSEIILPPMMFIILNLVFFGILLLFVIKASTGALVYEQVYAKQVALLIDEAKSDMQILVDFEEGVKVAEKNKKTSDLIRVDNKTNQVIVNLGSKGGYSYKYFSDYEVNVYDHVEENLIIINIGDKVWPDVIRPVDFDKEFSDEELEKAMNFAKSNSIEGRTCFCEKDCDSYVKWISESSKEYNVNSLLILAVMMQESNCKSTLVSSASAKGLMQLMDETANEMGVKNSFDPEENIMGGTKYLRWLLDKYNNDFSLVLAGYNAGPTNVDKYGGVPPFSETQNYVKEVTKRYALLGDVLNVA